MISCSGSADCTAATALRNTHMTPDSCTDSVLQTTLVRKHHSSHVNEDRMGQPSAPPGISIWQAKGWQDDGAVGDEKVHVRRCQPLVC